MKKGKIVTITSIISLIIIALFISYNIINKKTFPTPSDIRNAIEKVEAGSFENRRTPPDSLFFLYSDNNSKSYLIVIHDKNINSVIKLNGDYNRIIQHTDNQEIYIIFNKNKPGNALFINKEEIINGYDSISISTEKFDLPNVTVQLNKNPNTCKKECLEIVKEIENRTILFYTLNSLEYLEIKTNAGIFSLQDFTFILHRY